jgi:alanine-synthesizing transaminase
MFSPSGRLPFRAAANAISQAVEARRAAGAPIIDLTETNPTRARLAYPPDLLAALSDPRALVYDPDPRGLASARRAIAADAGRRGAVISPESLVLTASTSEAYSWLFKLLCNPGEHVLVPQPSYPLFDHLTALEGVRTWPYRLEYHGRWEIAFDTIDAAPPDTRAVLVVSPNNPTGSMVSAAELEQLAQRCAARGWALVADEVFADYVLEDSGGVRDIASRAGILSFTFGGASKALGLPQVKLGWIGVGGPVHERDAAIEALSLIADTYLSVSTPVQLAAPHLLQAGAHVRAAIEERVRRNLARARRLAADAPACDVLRTEGGWSVVVRVPAIRTEERLVLDLLASEGVLVHPGYFFDFAREAYVVVSLLPDDEVFAEGMARLLRVASRA